MSGVAGEVFFYETPETVVSNTRAVLNGVTYAMVNVTSVRTHKVDANHLFSILFMAIGVFMIVISLKYADNWWIGILVGVPIITVGILFFRAELPAYVVLLGTAGSETHAQRSQDPKVIQNIVDAISKAIVHRG